jgi:glucose-6-phosphate isomerase
MPIFSIKQIPDPECMDSVFSKIDSELGRTLCLVVSKSGGTKETRNGMLEAGAAYDRAGLNFGSHPLAITCVGGELDKYAATNGWLKRFPMWDWVGGRTSEMSAVGLLLAALQGVAIDDLLAGAAACDHITQSNNAKESPATQLALMWGFSGNGKGPRI